MSKEPPVVYVLLGEDEFGIAQFLAELIARLGDASLVELNLTRLDGRSLTQAELVNAVGAAPFLAKRRLVIVTNPLARITSPTMQERFTEFLGQIPPTTALVLVEYRTLTSYKDRQAGKLHWLERWAEQARAEGYAFMRNFPLPKGRFMIDWMVKRAKELGGELTIQAAGELNRLIGDDPRLADQEIHKLLTYVDTRRRIELEDVMHLTPFARESDIFAMVDALGNQDGKQAISLLHHLLEEQEAMAILGMVVRQFRLLLQAREILNHGGDQGEVARQLKLFPAFVANKITEQARHFDQATLENVYHRLLDIDTAQKAGEMDVDLGLDVFIMEFAGQAPAWR
jgi:DNA polymerase-3 subunit delta